MIFPGQVGGISGSGPASKVALVQAGYHELFHVFQNTNLPNNQRDFNASNIYSKSDKGWLFESSARFVGFKTLQENFGSIKSHFGLNKRDLDYIYSGSSYSQIFAKVSKTILNLKSPYFQSPLFQIAMMLFIPEHI